MRGRPGVVLLATLSLAACANLPEEIDSHAASSSDDGPWEVEPTWDDDPAGTSCAVDELLEPHEYGAKVKTLLTGLPLDPEELATLRDDPTAFAAMIDSWLDTPEARRALERFFMIAFQQTGGDRDTLFHLLGRSATGTGRYENPRSASADELLLATFAESFARTAAWHVLEGASFRDVLTTDTYLMSTAQMVFLAYTDDEVVHDDGTRTVRTTGNRFPRLRIVRDPSAAPPLSSALDPSSPDFGTFWHGGLEELPASCGVTATVAIDTRAPIDTLFRLQSGISPSFFVFSHLVLGRHQRITHTDGGCTSQAKNAAPLLDRADFSDFHPVRVRRPIDGEPTTRFFAVESMRSADELVLHTEHVGFLTSPGFLTTWPTNEDNASRVTTNQALIVALGQSFDGVAVTDFSPTGLSADHAEPGTECFGCHQTLDPMREFFRGSRSSHYGDQLDPQRRGQPTDFVFGGVQAQGSSLRDFGQLLAGHPSMPSAWAHKLCSFANAGPCPEGEELDRVVGAFVASDLDFRVLLTELLASPLVTGARCLGGVDAGTTATITRRSTFCHALSSRTGIDDVCGSSGVEPESSPLRRAVGGSVASVPDDMFSRGVVAPITIASPSLFTRANAEAACMALAELGFDEIFPGAERETTVEALVTRVMGLPEGDPRRAEARAIVADHVTRAIEEGASEHDALRSALAIACMSPTLAGLGF